MRQVESSRQASAGHAPALSALSTLSGGAGHSATGEDWQRKMGIWKKNPPCLGSENSKNIQKPRYAPICSNTVVFFENYFALVSFLGWYSIASWCTTCIYSCLTNVPGNYPMVFLLLSWSRCSPTVLHICRFLAPSLLANWSRPAPLTWGFQRNALGGGAAGLKASIHLPTFTNFRYFHFWILLANVSSCSVWGTVKTCIYFAFRIGETQAKRFTAKLFTRNLITPSTGAF